MSRVDFFLFAIFTINLIRWCHELTAYFTASINLWIYMPLPSPAVFIARKHVLLLYVQHTFYYTSPNSVASERANNGTKKSEERFLKKIVNPFCVSVQNVCIHFLKWLINITILSGGTCTPFQGLPMKPPI